MITENIASPNTAAAQNPKNLQKTGVLKAGMAALLCLALMPGAVEAKKNTAAPMPELTEKGAQLEAQFKGQMDSLKSEIEAALPKRDEAKVAAWLDAIQAEEGVAKEAAAKAKEVSSLQNTEKTLQKLELSAQQAPKTYADALEELQQAKAIGKEDPKKDKLLESEKSYLASITKERELLAGKIEKAKTAAKEAQAKLPEAIKAAEAAKQAHEKALSATWNAMDAMGMSGILSSDKLDGKLAQFMVINHATPLGLAKFAEKSPANEKLIQELLSNQALMLQMLVADGPNLGKYGEAMKIYTDIQKASAKAKDGVFQKLAVAVSLGHSVPIAIRVNNSKDSKEDNEPELSDATNEGVTDYTKFIDPVKRYLSYEKWYENGELDQGFKDLSVWNMVMAVDASDPDEILAWGRKALRNLRPDCIPNNGDTSVYVNVVDKEIAYTSAMVKNDLPEVAPMQNILSNGGICGRRAFYGRFTLRSFGVPTTARKQPGHATLAHWHPDGWQTRLGGNWGLGARGNYSSMSRARSSSYGADVNFLASTQAREDVAAFMQVKRAQWIGALLGEPAKPGLITFSGKQRGPAKNKSAELAKPIFWNDLALQEQRRIVAGLESAKNATSSSATAAASAPAATGTITVDENGVITIPSAACSSPTESTTKVSNGAVKDLVVFVKNKAGDTLLHFSRYGTGVDSFEYTFDAPKAGKYKLTADVVTPMPNHKLMVAANGGADAVMALPYTIGMWGTTQPIEIELKAGRNVLKFHGPARVTIKDFTLTPVQ